MCKVKQDCESIMYNLRGMFEAGRVINNMPKSMFKYLFAVSSNT
jgi:hypothetical protein